MILVLSIPHWIVSGHPLVVCDTDGITLGNPIVSSTVGDMVGKSSQTPHLPI
jgi:hypothetical protein